MSGRQARPPPPQQQQQQRQQQQPIRAVITGNSLVKEHTEYQVELCAGAAKLSAVSRRFREFIELHAQLTKFRHAFPIPDVPPKKFFGRTNPDFVKQRQRELQSFLDQLVNSIVANPPSEAAWRLLCLFLALDPKQFVPESILNLADQSAGGRHGDAQQAGSTNPTSTAAAASAAAAGGATTPGSRAGGPGSAAAPGAVAADGGQASAFNAGRQDTEVDEVQDSQAREAEERSRMERIVDNFARQTINVGRNAEERLQHAPSTLVDRLPLDALQKSLQQYILSAPLPAPDARPAGSSHESRLEDGNEDDGNEHTGDEDDGGDDGEDDDNEEMGSRDGEANAGKGAMSIQNAEDVVVYFD